LTKLGRYAIFTVTFFMNRDQSNRRDKRKRFSAFLVFLMCCVMLFTSCGEEEKQTEEKMSGVNFTTFPLKSAVQNVFRIILI